MKTKIIREDCIACGNCNAICPEVYDYDEDGIAYCVLDDNTMNEEVAEKYRSVVQEAQVNCPTEAVYVEED